MTALPAAMRFFRPLLEFLGYEVGRIMHDERSVGLAEQIAEEAPPALRDILAFSAGQARGHRDVIVRFGRHPHRNAILGRTSTPEELEYLEHGELVHQRRFRG